VRRWLSHRRRRRWVHPHDHEITKFFPNNPPMHGEAVLVDGERCKVIRCPVRWEGLQWTMKRGVLVQPDPLREDR
jgi:hypothetical protein